MKSQNPWMAVYDLVKEIVNIRKRHNCKRRHCKQRHRSKDLIKITPKRKRSCLDSSWITIALGGNSSPSASDEHQEISQRQQQQRVDPPGIIMNNLRRNEIMDEILHIYACVSGSNLNDFHRSVTKYVFQSYGPSAFYMDDNYKPPQ
ncbi:hypothetical protein Q1695_000950 [Nippostrongylus brasiliensis]|nr:hypothetical protein Q1695_000950 [Nippostrongylus brasiliensis]